MRYRGLLAVCALTVLAQSPTRESSTPIPHTGTAFEQFVPNGWALEQQKLADFNRDGRTDALLMMRRRQEGGTPERILAVVFRVAGNEYKLAELNNRLIPSSKDSSQEDPMADGELTVRAGGFDVKLSFLAGIGSYETASLRFRFRFQQGCFRLIGYDRLETHRGTLDTRDLSVNFLTGAVVHRTGNAQSGSTKVTSDKLRDNPPRCFSQLESADKFNPT